MPIQINKSLKGKEFPPYTVTVERGRIKDFARAIGDLNPFYLDDRVGAASEYGEVIAPPTFPITFRDEGFDTNALLKELGTDVSRILHGEQEYAWHRPIAPGETITAVATIHDIRGRPALEFLTLSTELRGEDGELVCTGRTRLIHRGGT